MRGFQYAGIALIGLAGLLFVAGVVILYPAQDPGTCPDAGQCSGAARARATELAFTSCTASFALVAAGAGLTAWRGPLVRRNA